MDFSVAQNRFAVIVYQNGSIERIGGFRLEESRDDMNMILSSSVAKSVNIWAVEPQRLMPPTHLAVFVARVEGRVPIGKDLREYNHIGTCCGGLTHYRRAVFRMQELSKRHFQSEKDLG